MKELGPSTNHVEMPELAGRSLDPPEPLEGKVEWGLFL
jgi:hypothetical protein